jgi:hypothetical protein
MRLTLSTSLAGLADTAAFAVTRRSVLAEKPDRAAGTVVSLALWAAVTQAAATGARRRARAVAAATLVANAAMLGVHLRAKVANPRVYAGVGLAAGALIGTFLGD